MVKVFPNHPVVFWPQILGNLFSSWILAVPLGETSKMAISTENLGFSLPQLCEMAKIWPNFPLFVKENKKISLSLCQIVSYDDYFQCCLEC